MSEETHCDAYGLITCNPQQSISATLTVILAPNYTPQGDKSCINLVLILKIAQTQMLTLTLQTGILGLDLLGHFVAFIKI